MHEKYACSLFLEDEEVRRYVLDIFVDKVYIYIEKNGYHLHITYFVYGPVAQLVRAPPCHGGGRRFESDLGRSYKLPYLYGSLYIYRSAGRADGFFIRK